MPQQNSTTTVYAKDGTPLDAGIVNLTKAMRKVESRDNYNIGLAGNRPGLSGEIGAYQWTPQTWQKHAQMAGINPADISPVNQDKVAYKVVEQYKKQGYTPEQIVSMWNAGEGKPNAYAENWRGRNSMGVAYDTPAHVKKVMAEFQRLKGTTAAPKEGIGTDIAKRVEQYKRGQADVESGIISPERGMLRTAGAVAGGVGDAAFRALSALTPDAIGEPAMQIAGEQIGKVIQSPVGQFATQKFQKLEEEKPQVAQDIRDVGNIAGVVPFGVGAGITGAAAKQGVKSSIEKAAARQVSGLAEDYAEALGTRAPLRGRVQRAEEKGKDLPTFLAEKAQGPDGVKLEVDSDGRVDATKLASKNESDLQGLYKLRSDLLKQYPETGDIEEFRKLALKAADSTQNKGKAIVGELQNEVNTIFDSFKASFGERIPLEVLQDIKIQQRFESKAFNALKPKRDRFSNANYIVSDAARKYIEDITKNPLVREVNDIIGTHLDADDLLERIKSGGLIVKGGRLGKTSATLLGGLVGTAAESALGPLVGGVLGNQLAGMLLKNRLSGPLRNVLLKKLQTEAPDVYKKVEDFIGAEELRRSQMLQLPAAGQSSFKDPTIFGREKGPGSTSLQEAVDAEGIKGLLKPFKRK